MSGPSPEYTVAPPPCNPHRWGEWKKGGTLDQRRFMAVPIYRRYCLVCGEEAIKDGDFDLYEWLKGGK